MKQNTNKDLNITPLTLKNNLKIILGSKLGKVKNIEAQQKIRYSDKKSVYLINKPKSHNQEKCILY